MFEDDFLKMLRDYPHAVLDKKVFAGFMKDLFPGQQMQVNLLSTAYSNCVELQTRKAHYRLFVPDGNLLQTVLQLIQ